MHKMLMLWALYVLTGASATAGPPPNHCVLTRHINISSLLGQPFNPLEKYFEIFQEENHHHVGGGILLKKHYQRFGISSPIYEVSVDVFEKSVVAVLISFADPYADSSVNDALLKSWMRGCGKPVTSTCWSLSPTVEVDATHVYPYFVRIQHPESMLKSTKVHGNTTMFTPEMTVPSASCVRYLPSYSHPDSN